MLGSKTWHDRIINRTDADIFEPKTKKENGIVKIENGVATTPKNAGEPMDVSEIKKEVPDEMEEVPKTLEEQAADEIIEDLKSNVVKVEDRNLAVPMPETDSLHGTQQVTDLILFILKLLFLIFFINLFIFVIIYRRNPLTM